MTALIRYLRGTVRFTVRGDFPERFINLCAARGIALWDASREKGCCRFTTRAGYYKHLRPCARRAGVRLRVEQRRGLPFRLRRHRRRWGLPVGAALCLAALALSSQFLWDVRVTGNERLDSRAIREELEALGVRPGALSSSIDVRSVERRMMLRLEDLSWIAVNLRGSTAHVQVKERVLPPAILDREQPCNVVAARGGQITAMQVYVGQPMVAVGDAVADGDILVSGVVEAPDKDIHLVAARADITAQTTRSLRVEVPLEQTSSRLEKVLRRFSLRVGQLELPLWVGKPPQGPFRLERMYAPVTFFGIPTPLAVGQRQYLLLEQSPAVLTREEAALQARQQLARLEQEAFGQGEILSRRESVTLEDGILTMTAEYTALEVISVQSEILTPEEDPAPVF